MWNGSQMLSSAPNADAATEPNGANNINVDCAWINFTTAIFGFVDADSLAMDYFTFDKANTWSTSDLTSTSTTSNFGSDDLASIGFSKHPVTQAIMVTGMDIAEDLTAIWWNGSSFETITASPFEDRTEVQDGAQEGIIAL